MPEEIRSWPRVSLAGLPPVAKELKSLLRLPCALILTGDLGAGKTTFTQHFARLCGQEGILSPSYSLVNRHGSLVHADFYRLENPRELVHLELPLYLEECQYFLVEWGERFAEALEDMLPGHFQAYQVVIKGDGAHRRYHLSRLAKRI